MGVLEDIRNWLKEIPIWQELEKLPDRTASLEARVAELEAKLQPIPGERCEGCGELALRLESSRIVGAGTAKYTKKKWRCQSCKRAFETKE